jgi:hypothetical protein
MKNPLIEINRLSYKHRISIIRYSHQFPVSLDVMDFLECFIRNACGSTDKRL